jgi:threonine efflux protein
MDSLAVQSLPSDLLLAYTAYLLGTLSPGPSNLLIMSTAITAGRRAAVVLAAGVVTGSLFWGLLAAFGLSAALASSAWALIAMKLLGGLYLLWLAFKSARAAWRREDFATSAGKQPASQRWHVFYLRGTAMHFTNPKAIFVWLSIVTLALPASAKQGDALWVVAGCGVIAVLVFGAYALVFSTPTARRVYGRVRRWVDGSLALVFGYGGLRMLFSRTAA